MFSRRLLCSLIILVTISPVSRAQSNSCQVDDRINWHRGGAEEKLLKSTQTPKKTKAPKSTKPPSATEAPKKTKASKKTKTPTTDTPKKTTAPKKGKASKRRRELLVAHEGHVDVESNWHTIITERLLMSPKAPKIIKAP